MYGPNNSSWKQCCDYNYESNHSSPNTWGEKDDIKMTKCSVNSDLLQKQEYGRKSYLPVHETHCCHKVSVLACWRNQIWHHKWFMEIFSFCWAEPWTWWWWWGRDLLSANIIMLFVCIWGCHGCACWRHIHLNLRLSELCAECVCSQQLPPAFPLQHFHTTYCSQCGIFIFLSHPQLTRCFSVHLSFPCKCMFHLPIPHTVICTHPPPVLLFFPPPYTAMCGRLAQAVLSILVSYCQCIVASNPVKMLWEYCINLSLFLHPPPTPHPSPSLEKRASC